jgi:uncharacterized glyoxalase superfamily protein PhnB
MLLPLVIPILRYRDPAAAIAWLVAALGFRSHFVAEEGGLIVHAQLRLGEALIMLGPEHQDDAYGMRSPLSLNGTNQGVYIAIDEDIDAHCARAEAAGAIIVTAPYDPAYGGREYSCRDLEGHVWSIGSYRGELG